MSGSDAEREMVKAEQPFDPYLGKIVHGFEIKKLIGEGGMGRVYLALQQSLKRNVALKILASKFVSNNEAFSTRFLREATTAAQIAHQNIVQVIDAGEEGGIYYIAMELVEGMPIDSLIRQEGILPLKAAVDIILQAARGLAAAEKKKLVHRDIKPSNLMMTEDGIVKVADFGLAKNTEATAILTTDGQILGTPAFMSPEQGKGRPADHRSDQYSLGVTFFVLVTGTLPFKGESSVSIIYQHISDPVPDPALRNPTLPRAVADIIIKMMSKKPDERFPHFPNLIAELDELDGQILADGLADIQNVQADAGDTSGEQTVVMGDGDITPLTRGGPAVPLAEKNIEAEHPVIEDYSSLPAESVQTEYWQAEGDLQSRDIGFVLKEIARERKVGILTVTTESKATSLYIDDDKVSLYSVDGRNAIRIGDILLRHGHIDDDQLSEALEAQREIKKLLGDTLIELGHISSEERDSAMNMQIEEEFFELFTVREGRYKFIKQKISPQEFDDRYRINGNAFAIVDIIRDARQKVSDWKRVLHDLRDDKEIFVLKKEMSDHLEDIADPLERKILERLTGENNLADIVDQLLVPTFRVFKIVGKYLEMDKIYRPSLDDLKKGAAYMRGEMKFPVAAKLLERAFNVAPEDTTIIRDLADTYKELLDTRKAAAYYKILAKKFFDQGKEADGLGLCQTIVRLYPADSFAFERLFEFNVRERNVPAAMEMARGLFRSRMSEGDCSKAREAAAFILEHEPDDLPILRKLVNLNLEEGNIPEAIEGFERIMGLIESNPEMPPSQKTTELAQVWEKVLRLDPSRDDLRKKLDAIAREKEPSGRRIPYSLKVGLAVTALLLVIAGVGAYYELSARGLYKEVHEKAMALERQGKYIEAVTEYGKVLSKYSLSSMASRAEERRKELLVKEDRRQKELGRIKEELKGKLANAYVLLDKGNVDGAKRIFQTIKMLDVPPSMKIDANRGLAKIEALRRAKEEKRFNLYIDKARAAMSDGRALEKDDSLESLVKARLRYIEGLSWLRRVTGKYAETWGTTVESLSALIYADVSSVEKRMQKTHLDFAEKGWERPSVPAETVLEIVRKALAFEGVDKIRKRALALRDKVQDYIREAEELYDEAWKPYKSQKNQPPAEKETILKEVVEGLKEILEKYPRSQTSRRLRFPLLVVTHPRGAVLSGENIRAEGPTPTLLFYPPYEIVNVSVTRPGYEPYEFRTSSDLFLNTIRLSKTHLARWKTGGSIEARAVIHQGWLLVGDRGGKVKAYPLPAKEGEPRLRWEPFQVEDFGGIKAALVCSDTRIFLCTASQGFLYALDPETGKAAWPKPFRASRMVDHHPVLIQEKNLVIVGDVGGTVYAVHAATGELAWKTQISKEVGIHMPPVVDESGEHVYVSHSGGVARLGTAKGEIEWLLPLGTIDNVHLALAGNFLAVTVGETLLAYRVDGPHRPSGPLWSKEGRSHLTPPAIAGGLIYVGNTDGEIRAFSLTSGELNGRYAELGGYSFALPPVLLVGRALLLSNGNTLISFDTSGESFRPRWTFTLPQKLSDVPVVQGDRIYLAMSDGEIIVLEND
jgi:outer membrane protein assembly factor BamB/tetratricopeptide (TPR) repeat protein